MQKQKQNYIAFPLFLVGIALSLQALAYANTLEASGRVPQFDRQASADTVALPPVYKTNLCGLDTVDCENEITAVVTGFNTVEEQTDSTPCEAAGGNICGRKNVAACPRKYPIGTKVMIKGEVYTCLDRLAKKYDNRFDLSFDKNVEAAKQWGKQTLVVTILQ